MIGLTLLRSKTDESAPLLNIKRAQAVIGRVDEILTQEEAATHVRESRFVELGKYLCEIRSAQYWRFENLQSFDQFLEDRFPGSRRRAYYLMALHEKSHPKVKPHLKEIGFAKGIELMRVARADGERFDSASWLHRAVHRSKDELKHEVEEHLAKRKLEPAELIYFRLLKSQLPVVEGALEAAARLLGADRSRGYCLEMICADFLAGASLDHDPESLLLSVKRLIELMPNQQKSFLIESVARAKDQKDL